MSKRAGESFAASASAKQKPVRCTAMVARRIDRQECRHGQSHSTSPDHKAGGDSERDDMCQQDPQAFTITATGASYWQRLVPEIRQTLVKGKFIFRQTLMDKITSGSSMIQQKVFSLRTTRNRNSERKSCTASVLKLGRTPHTFAIFHSIHEASSRATAYELHFLPSKDHEDSKRMAMNRRFPRTQYLMQSVQRQVKTLIERKYAYKMQVSQDWKHFFGHESRC